ncbi:MAG: HNH endonuclease [Pyrinomonadaceae bacterium]
MAARAIMRNDILEREAEIRSWVAERRSKAFICRELRCKPLTLDSYLKKFGLTYRGNMGGKGYKQSPHRKSAREYLKKDSSISSHKLKLRLLRDGLKEHCCERCGRSKWRREPIPIELHHVNGNRFDNRLENLQLLCPNCHALTDNHAGKGSRRSLKV